MRLVADENFPGQAIQALREKGHDVSWVLETAPGANDENVIQLANEGRRVLITLDKDFGRLAVHGTTRITEGIVLFRVATDNPTRFAVLVTKVWKAVTTGQATSAWLKLTELGCASSRTGVTYQAYKTQNTASTQLRCLRVIKDKPATTHFASGS